MRTSNLPCNPSSGSNRDVRGNAAVTGMTRRRFLEQTAAAAIGLALVGSGCSGQTTGRREVPAPKGVQAYLSVARGADAAAITAAAIEALGGIGRFVRRGDDVIIKPNICIDYRPPEFAATTNPAVVATLVRLCRGAGARKVRVMDTPFSGTAEAGHAVSGIGEAVAEAGGVMEVMSPVKFVEHDIPQG